VTDEPTVLTKDLLRVSRAGGGYHPQFADADDRPVAAQVVGCYQGHVGRPREALDDALTDIERRSDDFKLVRGFAKLLDREAGYETRAPVAPERAREAAFAAAEAVGVATTAERERALARAADRLDADPDAVARSLYADRESRQVLTDAPDRRSPEALVEWYNLALAQTALFDATEARIRSSDPRTLVTATKRLGLMYEVRAGDDWEVVVTGPDSLFRSTRRYGTRLARLLRTVAGAPAWHLTATIDDRGTERTMTLSDDDPVVVAGAGPDERYDSDVEADFATRFRSLDLDWDLVREPEPLVVGETVMIPDFAFDYRFSDYRVFFEIMGFWTPEYVEKKLGQLGSVEDVEMLVAVDESLGVSEAVEARDHRAVTYSGSVHLGDVRAVLRRYEERLERAARADLPDELRPDADAVPLARVAADRGVSESALEAVSFPAHERVGRTLVRPAVLEAVASELEPGRSLADAEAVLSEWDLTETSAVLSRLGYEVAWEGLDGGTLRPKE
jgi:hypothetical protein